MKTAARTSTGAESFTALPKDYTGLCQRYVPRPLHDAADYAAARQAIEPLLGSLIAAVNGSNNCIL
jgi:hypothetical protein